MTIKPKFVIALLLVIIVGSAVADAEATVGEKVVAFCQQHKGQKVGDGECSSLAWKALGAAGAKGRGKDAPEKGDYTWGKLVLLAQGGDGKTQFEDGAPADVQVGDIIQFRDAKFVHHQGKRTSWLNFEHHTAVVASVDGQVVHIFQENFGGKKIVTAGTLNLDELTKGWLRFYHPVPKIIIIKKSAA